MMPKTESVHAALHIVIVGAGFSGTSTAIHLLREHTATPCSIALLDSAGTFGPGLAYGVRDDDLLLNVPAGNMSVLPDDPDDFLAYCRERDPSLHSGSFVARRVFGEYLIHTLARAEQQHGVAVRRIAGEAVAVKKRTTGPRAFDVSLAGGGALSADAVVLALGHFPPVGPRPPELARAHAYVHNPWLPNALDHVAPDRPTLVLGSGHTAADVVLKLTGTNPRRRVFVLSRRGLVPHAHRPSSGPPAVTGFPPYLQSISPTVRAHIDALRRAAALGAADGKDWRDTLNELRPHLPEVWRRWTVTERRKFLSRVVAYWDVHRHRLAPSAHLRFMQAVQAGQVEVLAGRVRSYAMRDDDITVVVQPRYRETTRELRVGTIVNCTGPNYDLDTIAAPLVTQLRAAGLVQPDPLRIGLMLDDRCRVVDAQGQAIPNLFYVGPMLKARFWEAIAVPELRVHAQRLARTILAGPRPIVMIPTFTP